MDLYLYQQQLHLYTQRLNQEVRSVQDLIQKEDQEMVDFEEDMGYISYGSKRRYEHTQGTVKVSR